MRELEGLLDRQIGEGGEERGKEEGRKGKDIKEEEEEEEGREGEGIRKNR